MAILHEHFNNKANNQFNCRQLYGALANLSMGYPTQELNQQSSDFLQECYEVGVQFELVVYYNIIDLCYCVLGNQTGTKERCRLQ